MANWCSNIIEFTGDAQQLESLKSLFDDMALKEKETRHGQLPDFIAGEQGGYFFETAWENHILHYETKWSPNIDIVTEIADRYGVDFTYSYSEPGMCIFGEATYKDGLLTDIYLDDQDYEQINYDEEREEYQFEGETYDSDYEILETLLERKKDDSRQQGYPKR